MKTKELGPPDTMFKDDNYESDNDDGNDVNKCSP